jgi:hypothetical protein
MLVTFIVDFVLVRQLTPYDFGRIRMLAIFMTVVETLIDGCIYYVSCTSLSEDKFFDLSLYMDGIIKALVYVMLYMG